MPADPAPDLSPDAHAAILAAGRDYFAGRRARVPGFVRTEFGWRGTLRLHRAALGWDILRAPVNVLLSPVFVLTRLAAGAARMAGARRLADWLAARGVLLVTDVARAVERRIVQGLLELPLPGRGGPDALAAAVLSAPQVRDLIRRRADVAEAAALGQRAARSLGEYSGARVAVADMTTALGTLGAGAVAFQALTPGMMSVAPALAALLAHNAALAAFPLGVTAGGLWYGVFPQDVPLLLSAGALVGMMMLGALVAAFAGLIADPVQVWTGIHRRRLLRLIATLEADFTGPGPAGFTAREHYLARLLDLTDAGLVAVRMLRG